MADVTEIIEESAVQLEIVELGGGQIEITGESPTQIEIIETISTSNDLDITSQTNTLVVENTSDSTNIDISVDLSTTVETTTTNNVVEIIENIVSAFPFEGKAEITGSLEVLGNTTIVGDTTITGSLIISSSNTFTNLGPFNQVGDFIVETGTLTVSENIFSEVISASFISASSATFKGDGITDIITVGSASAFPLIVNSNGLIVLDNYNYTPTPIEGGFLLSGSDFYIGLE